jgi:hypothetical protein
MNFQYSVKLQLPFLLSPLVSLIVNKGNSNSIIYVFNLIGIWQLRCLRRAEQISVEQSESPWSESPRHGMSFRAAERVFAQRSKALRSEASLCAAERVSS